MRLGFSDEVVDYYQKYRRGYPAPVIDALAAALQLRGSDVASQRRYAASLLRAGFQVSETSVEYTAELDLEHLVGGLYSAMSVDRLPAPEQRPEFAEQIRRALHPADRFSEHVRVAMLIGRKH